MQNFFSSKQLSVKARQCGFGMIELLVTMVIVFIMALAVFGVLSSSEGRKRTLTATNDVNQSGNYAMYQIDKAVRQAGSGFSYGGIMAQAFGCQLFANLNSTTHPSAAIMPLPSSTSMGPPFASVGTTLGGVFRLAPIVIAAGGTTPGASGNPSDVLVVMSGTSGQSEFYTQISGATATSVSVLSSTSFSKGDLVLLIPGDTFPGNCMVEEVSPSTALAVGTLALGDAAAPTYYANPISGEDLTTALWSSNTSLAMNIGNVNNNLPSFQMIGVGDNDVLYSYDLFQGSTFNTSIPITDGVFELHALYGLYDGTWVNPTSGTGYDFATLENGSAASNLKLQNITAIRLGLIMRSALQEQAPASGQNPATTGPITLFSDLGSTYTVTRALATAEQNYRYRTIEETIPLRNVIMARPAP